MTGLLDPQTPWPWLLYTLAGVGFVTWLLPEVLNVGTQAVRDVTRSVPALMALLYVIAWLFWPLVAAWLLLGLIQWLAWWPGYWVWLVRRWIRTRKAQG